MAQIIPCGVMVDHGTNVLEPAVAMLQDDGGKWGSGPTDGTANVILDLGSAASVSEIVIYWANDWWATSYTIDVSDDLSSWSTIYSQPSGTGGIDGVETITGLTGEGRFLRFAFTSSVTGGPDNLFGIRYIEIDGTPGLTQRYTGTYTGDATGEEQAADKAGDGDWETRWASWDPSTTLYIDLGVAQSVSGIDVGWEYTGPDSFALEYSNDNSSWTEAYSTTDTQILGHIALFTPVSARYWRLLPDGHNSAWEVALMAPTGIVPPPEDVTITPTPVAAVTTRAGVQVYIAPLILTTGDWNPLFPLADSSYTVPFTQGMAIDPNDNATIYLCMVADPAGQDICGVWRSNNYGLTWTRISGPGIGGPGQPINLIFPDPSNSDLMFVSDGVRGDTNGVWRTTDGGETWEYPGDFVSVSPVLDCYHVAADPGDPDHILVSYHSSPSGVCETLDGGETWEWIPPPDGLEDSAGVNTDFLYAPGVVGNSQTWLYSTQSSGKYRTTDGGDSWTQVTEINMDHGGGQLVYVGSTLYASGSPVLSRSDDNGETWESIGPTTDPYWLCVATDGSYLYTGRHFGGPALQAALPVIDDDSWTQLPAEYEFSFGGGPFQMVYDPATRRLYAAATNSGLYVYQFPLETPMTSALFFSPIGLQ